MNLDIVSWEVFTVIKVLTIELVLSFVQALRVHIHACTCLAMHILRYIGPTSWPTTDKKLAHHCMGPRQVIGKPIATLHNIALIINALKDANNTT